MKKGIHPEYKDMKVTCSCGNTFTVKSNRDSLHVETCNKCHPFYTGNQTSTVQRGRIEKFNQKYGFSQKTEK
jgi:large subunit ribosomal protein L31